MKGKKVLNKVLSSILSCAMAASMVTPVYADTKADEVPKTDAVLSMEQVESVKATTAPNFYGQRLYQVEITFADGTDMTAAADPANYDIWDRSFTDGTYEEGSDSIAEVTVSGQTATLTFDQGNADNKPFGMLCTASWNYARKDSEVYNTVVNMAQKQAGDEFAKVAYGGYQTRDNLDLVLYVGEESTVDENGTPVGGLALTDGYGNKLENTVWETTENIDYDDFTLEYWDIAQTPSKYTQFDGKVPVYYYVPDSYNDETPMTLVLYVTGAGTSYYEKLDADGNLLAANKGTDMSYDNCCASWKNLSEDSDPSNDVIIGTVDVYSSDNPKAGAELAAAAQKFVDNYNIKNVIVIGNSNGTSVCSEAVRQRPDLIDAFLINNGCIGTKRNTSISDNLEAMAEFEWSEEEIQAIVDNGVAFWILNGERDNLADPTYALKSMNTLKEKYAEAGYSQEFIDDNLRTSFYKSEKFDAWGVNNHSCIKMTSWYYVDEPYLNVFGDEKLQPGDTYTMDNPLDTFLLDLTTFTFTVYGESVSEWALERGAEAGEEAVDMDSITSLSVDLTQAAQLPLTGYFTKAIGEDRSVKVYISDNASTRSYFTVVAVPDGVDTREFLEESGWIDLADERGECLFVLEPGKDGWGTQAEEADYVNSAIAFLRSTRNANNVALFSTFGEFYFVGYGNGAAPLEAWAAANPLFVIAQAYLNDEGLTAEYFDTVKDKVHNGSTSGYLNISEALTAEIGEENLITNKDIPIPTLLAGYGAESQAYWMNANDCVAEAADSDMGKVYVQAEDSDAWATRANGPISQVIVEDSIEKVAAVTNALAAFLYQYSRYDNSTAYGDSLALRMDYADARVNAQTAAKDGTVKESFDGVDVIGQASTQIENHGTLTVGVISFADVNGDGVNDPREYYMYVPAGFEGKKLPVIYVWAGGSQTNNIFFDATNWAKVADENGVILMFPGEGQSTNPVGVGYWGTKEFYDALQVILAQQVDGKIADVDFSRVYSTGQSAGSGTTTGFMVTNPEMFAAVASTSGIPSASSLESGSFEMVPTYTIFGQGDIDHGTLWDDVDNKIDAWVPYVLKANGLGTVGPEEETEKTQDGRFITWYWRNSQGIALMQQGQTKYRAHNCYPMEMAMMWDYLEHFSYEVAEDGTITRYYSASAFAEDDAVVIVKDAVYETAVDFNTLEAPTHDYTESNQMPLTGYFKTALSGDYANREVYFYIPDTAMIRPYYHFITVPNNVNVDEWIVTSGWKQVSDETGECLYIMTPDAATGVWGSLEDEVGYITAAKAKHGGVGAYFSTFGEFYLEGYGAGAAPLEAWAAENPQFVISQAYIGGESAGSDVLTAAGETSYSWKHMTDGDIRGGRVDADGNQKILGQIVPRFADIINSDKTGYEGLLTKGDMAVPTWLINEDAEDSLSYWQDVNKTGEANQTVTAFAGAEAAGQVYPQAGDTWTTEYAGQISKVTTISTAADTEAYEFTRALRDDLTDYTRYDNTISYGNALTYRMDITSIEVERYTSEEKEASGKTEAIDQNGNVVEGEVTIKALTTSDGYITDMLLYVPETAGDEEIPVVVVWHGGSQTGHLFMDASAWWQVAATKGFAIVLPTRTNHNQRTTSDYDLTIFDALEDYLRKDGRFDMGRVYSSGQSMGGLATTEMAEFRTDKIAAGVATGAGTPSAYNGGDPIPFGYMSGEANYTLRGIPGYMANTNYPEDETTDLVRSTEAAEAGADIYWDAVEDAEGNLTQFAKWISYFYDANKLDENDLSPYIEYSGGNALNGGTNNAQGTLADWNTNNARYRMWTWYNEDGIPVLKYGMVLAAAHNNLVGYADYIWDYVKNYRVDPDADGVVVRTYSASGFELDDAQEITFGHEEPVEKQDQKIDTAVSGNILTAYGSKSFNLEAETSGDGRLTYKSSNKNVAKVSKTGEVSIVGTGKAVITITAHSTDTCNLAVKKIVIRVVPAKAELKKVEKAGKGALKATVKKDSKASGYMIQISADKNFKKSVTIVLDKKSQTSVTIKNLISGKKYYVRACAYKSIGGNKYGGAYSAVKTVKVK